MPLTKHRILVVDDDNFVRELLVKRINMHDYEAVPAGNGREALDKIDQQPFDLILLDIMMPELDGYQVLQQLQEKQNQIPVVVMSALDEVDGVIRCMKLGADDYLRKPINEKLLWSRLRASLEKKQLRDREQARVAELKLLQKIDRALNRTLDLMEVSQLTLSYAMQQTDAKVGMIGFIRDKQLKVIATNGLPDGMQPPSLVPITENTAPIQRPLSTTEKLLPETDNRITIPIQRNRILQMAIALDTVAVCPPDTLDFLARLSNHAAIALHNAQLYEDTQAANQAKTNFVAMVSHELKNPLQAILTYADLMQRQNHGDMTQKHSEYLEIVTLSARRILNLSRELDDITRMETGNFELNVTNFSFPKALQRVLDLVQRQLEEKEQTLEVSMASELPLIRADQQRLEQILLNLISNAIKYTPAGGEITLEAYSLQEKGKQWLQITVSDNGIGISDTDQTLIFSQFFRANDPQVRAQNGTGLGLHITQKLVSLHGGEISFQSEPGKGTTFYFTLPMAEAAPVTETVLIPENAS